MLQDCCIAERRFRHRHGSASAVGFWCGAVWTAACDRLAGVLLCECVQREHRRLEHRVGDDAVVGVRPSAVAHIAARNQLKCGRGSGPAQAVAAQNVGCTPKQMWAANSGGDLGESDVGEIAVADVGEFLALTWAKSRQMWIDEAHFDA